MRLIPTILCGGAGSRLWSVSRELHPKPFIRLADGQRLLQKACLRGALLPGVAEILTITNRELFFKTKDEYRELGGEPIAASYVLEPFGRGTAAAIASAALTTAKAHGELSVATNQSIFIPAGNKHCLENATRAPLAMIEVQSGDYPRRGRHRALRRQVRPRAGVVAMTARVIFAGRAG
jgi:mannose-1-phosphate guanylyltransferase